MTDVARGASPLASLSFGSEAVWLLGRSKRTPSSSMAVHDVFSIMQATGFRSVRATVTPPGKFRVTLARLTIGRLFRTFDSTSPVFRRTSGVPTYSATAAFTSASATPAPAPRTSTPPDRRASSGLKKTTQARRTSAAPATEARTIRRLRTRRRSARRSRRRSVMSTGSDSRFDAAARQPREGPPSTISATTACPWRSRLSGARFGSPRRSAPARPAALRWPRLATPETAVCSPVRASEGLDGLREEAASGLSGRRDPSSGRRAPSSSARLLGRLGGLIAARSGRGSSGRARSRRLRPRS